MEQVRRKQGKQRPETLSEPLPLEDMVLKTAVQYFGDELLPYLGIREKVYTVAPTEQIRLEARLLKEADALGKDENLKMQAVLYALANKFLDDKELKQVKEVLSMTRLGEMLLNDGIEKGIQAMVTSFQELGISYEESVKKVQEKFALDPDAAQEYMEKYWR